MGHGLVVQPALPKVLYGKGVFRPKNVRPDGMWDHWIVYNTPAATGHIPEGKGPPGRHGKGTNGNQDYTGPCPPDREHRYFFKLFALDQKLDLQENVAKSEVEKAMEGHILEKTELMGTYQRSG